jgi:WD40 repeat protein
VYPARIDDHGREIARLQGHLAPVIGAAWSPDCRRILTASRDNTARTWDVARTAAMVGDRAVVLTAALAGGLGWRTDAEAAGL